MIEIIVPMILNYKTKVLLIAVIAGFIMPAFISCEKQATNAKIKIIESSIARLEKNYADLTRSEFDEDYRYYMNELNQISKGDLTKNQKDKISNLKWRLREVWLRYYNPFSERLHEGDRLMGQDVAALLPKHGTDEKCDTISLEAYLTEFEKMTTALEAIHVESAADTLQLLALEKKYAHNSVLDSDIEVNVDHLKHTEKARYLQAIVSYFNAIITLDQELKMVGVKSSKWNLGEDEESFKAIQKEFQDALRLELE